MGSGHGVRDIIGTGVGEMIQIKIGKWELQADFFGLFVVLMAIAFVVYGLTEIFG